MMVKRVNGTLPHVAKEIIMTDVKMSKQQALARIAEIENTIMALIHEGVNISNEHGLKLEIPHNTYMSKGFGEAITKDEERYYELVEEFGEEEGTKKYEEEGGKYLFEDYSYEGWAGWQSSYC